MGRHATYAKVDVISTRLEFEFHQQLKDIAALETSVTGKYISVQELIRDALNFVYKDGEKMRECFRRSRMGKSNRKRRNYLKSKW